MKNEVVLDHRESHFNMTADNHDEWIVFTDDPYWIRRLDKIATGKPVANGDGKQYTLRADQVLVRAKKRAVSEENRQKSSERMRLLKHRMAVEKLTPDVELER